MAEEEKEYSARELIDETAQEEGTFEILTKTGRKIVIRRVVDYSVIAGLRKKAAQIYRAGQKNVVPDAWKPYLPITEQAADIVADLSGLIVSPPFRDVDVMELCKKSGMTAVYIHGLIKQSWKESLPVAEEEQILEEKNG